MVQIGACVWAERSGLNREGVSWPSQLNREGVSWPSQLNREGVSWPSQTIDALG